MYGHDKNPSHSPCRSHLRQPDTAGVGAAGGHHGRRHARQGKRRKGVPEAPVLALCGTQLPDAPVLRRHAFTYVVLDGRWSLWRAARAEGRLSLRQGRGDQRLQRPTGEALPARSISWWWPTTPTTWASSQTCLPGDPKVLADPTGRRWYDMVQSGKGADAAIEIIVAFSQGTFPKALLYAPGTPGLPVGLAADHRGRGGGERPGPLHGLHRLRVDLEHRRQQPAPQRHFPRRRRPSQPGGAVHRLPAAGQR